MDNEKFIILTKVWNDRDGNYGEKKYYLNPAIPIEGIEGCKVKNGKEQIECTKIFYPEKDGIKKFITVKGTPDTFFDMCRDANLAICLVHDIYKEGLTIKQFLKQIEGYNGVNLG